MLLFSYEGDLHYLLKEELVLCLDFQESLDMEIKDELQLIWSELKPYANPPKEAIPTLKIELENVY